jgi:hypothetical protein
MSTTSAYSSNKLKQVINNKTDHFITKSYIYASFEHDRRKSEYHLYWYNAKKGIYNDLHRYQCLSHKLLNKREMTYFLENLHLYTKEVDSEDGILWVNKEIGFDKDKVVIKQYQLSI